MRHRFVAQRPGILGFGQLPLVGKRLENEVLALNWRTVMKLHRLLRTSLSSRDRGSNCPEVGWASTLLRQAAGNATRPTAEGSRSNSNWVRPFLTAGVYLTSIVPSDEKRMSGGSVPARNGLPK